MTKEILNACGTNSLLFIGILMSDYVGTLPGTYLVAMITGIRIMSVFYAKIFLTRNGLYDVVFTKMFNGSNEFPTCKLGRLTLDFDFKEFDDKGEGQVFISDRMMRKGFVEFPDDYEGRLCNTQLPGFLLKLTKPGLELFHSPFGNRDCGYLFKFYCLSCICCSIHTPYMHLVSIVSAFILYILMQVAIHSS
jgi:hypothetical protein